ncbi:multisubunit sodium/proton antiporter MrpC subunit [Isoptericola sp. CG 20/1183]|uniref:Multisubunit sodium/proton antiporter MrpC subunit n=1 Tax=Isoptericola halotolerans TaxID=300560 RepID=A0ABX5EKW1_9MICO|nr:MULTISPECIES: Na(+)/H(+) antiporter subunit C [Isoptericola]PRZ09353.1 multisubunit sodium/proton antiporter MrpC subunit [Isoptericola sp. CG 20/1183]PRZ10154.1 multisubunit sodium/proton antiporter MrpC subunit [Isoptericola halotolerans]
MIVLENTPSAVLLLAVGVLCGAGVYLLLDRPLTRVLLGIVLLSNGANLMLLVAGGRAGASPVVGNAPADVRMSDPLAQAMILTAIVITLALTSFVLALAYRSWQLHGHDEVADDEEDRRVARQAADNAPAYEDSDAAETGETLDEEAATVYDQVVERAERLRAQRERDERDQHGPQGGGAR